MAYYSNAELVSYRERFANYDRALEQWREIADAWNDDDGPAPEPPAPPPLPTLTFEARDVDEEGEEIETPNGTALAMPPSLVITSSEGERFAVLPDDFARAYTSESDVDFETSPGPRVKPKPKARRRKT